MSKNAIIVVQGAQWGSEAKGAIAAYLCVKRDVTYAVRTGAINAGHTVFHNGKEFKMQQLPVGFVHPGTKLVIGAGALVHPFQLMKEVNMLEDNGFPDIKDRIYIDYRAGLHTDKHTDMSALSGRHHAMGATGKGCSEALMDRIRLRGSHGVLFRDTPIASTFNLVDTEILLNRGYDQGAQILLEGTQGSGLDLYFGPYPYTTHKSCQAATWVQEAGLSPALDYEVVLVARTYPIRVAGNSGPMPNEIGWVHLANSINERLKFCGKPHLVSNQALAEFMDRCRTVAGSMLYALPNGSDTDFWAWSPEEREQFKESISEFYKHVLTGLPEPTLTELRKLFELTTVTKKLRRIARFSQGVWDTAVRMNRPSSSYLTFANYVVPEVWGTTHISQWKEDSITHLLAWMKHNDVEGKFTHVTTGPLSENVIEFNPSVLGYR